MKVRQGRPTVAEIDRSALRWNLGQVQRRVKALKALEKQLELHVDHIREGRTPDDILHELLLKSGFPLTTPVEKQALAGKTVYIDSNNNGIFDSGEASVLTDSSGNYSLVLGPGSYRVRVVQQTGYTRTSPSLGYYQVTLSSGTILSSQNFGEKK